MWTIIEILVVIAIAAFLIKKYPAIKTVALFAKDQIANLIEWIKSLIKKK